MYNTHNISLEESTILADGQIQQPVICGACYHVQNKEHGARSTPKSYAAIAECEYRFQVINWKGLATTPCRCCGSNAYTERFTVELHRKRGQ